MNNHVVKSATFDLSIKVFIEILNHIIEWKSDQQLQTNSLNVQHE